MCWLKKCAGGGICSINTSQSIHSKFFKSISILISVFAFSVAGAACGGSDKDKPEPEQDAGIIEDAGIDECAAGHFGPNCEPCTCEHGTCSDGKAGSGKCSACDEGYWGENCASKTVTCIAGTPSLGINGDGKCTSCHANTGWSGENCDVCEGNYWGPSCNQVPTCTEHGTPSLGIEGTGLCTECEEGWDLDKNCAELADGYMLDKAGNVYKTTKIGDQTWMAQNMAWQDASVTCHANTEADADFIKNYGCLYTWEDANKVCPDGWHLPDKGEFEALLAYVEQNKTTVDNVFHALTLGSAWAHTSGTDDFGFTALPAGAWSATSDTYDRFGSRAGFWSTTDFDEYAYVLGLNETMATADLNSSAKADALSVRCLKTEVKCQHGTPDTTTGHCQANTCEEGYIGKDCDIENKCLHGTPDEKTGHCTGTCETGFDGVDCDIAVTNINGQIWMVKNMDATIGADGSSLNCQKFEDVSNYVERYGCRYHWFDAMKACPAGWHLPSLDEFTAMLNYVDEHKTSSSLFLALIPKSAEWVDYQGLGGDDFGFSLLPAGWLGANEVGTAAAFYISEPFYVDPVNGTTSVAAILIYDGQIETDPDNTTDTASETPGYSVRCLKDAVVTK